MVLIHPRQSRTLDMRHRLGSWMLLVVILCLISSSPSPGARVLWKFKIPAGYADSSPAVGDLDGDGSLDLVFCTTAGRVLALNAAGRQLWFHDVGATLSTPPTLVAKDRSAKVFVITNPGKVLCLDGKTGSRLWEYPMPGSADWGSTALAAADVNSDGRIEVLASDRKGHLVWLRDDGSVLWTKRLDAGVSTAPAIADLDGDGDVEILVGTKSAPLICLSDKGKELWRLQDGAVGSSPLVCDPDGDGKADILVGRGDGLSLISREGKEHWHYRMKKTVHDGIAVGDIDDDGRAEIIAVDLFGHTVCLDSQGHERWHANVEQRVRRSPAIADLDGDSIPEIIVGGYSAALHIFDPEGNLKERVSLQGVMNASPTVVDFHGTRRLALVCAATSEIAALSWLSGAPKVAPLVHWAEYRANSARTGSALQAAPSKRIRLAKMDYGNFYVGTNEFSATVVNPARKALRLELEIERDGRSFAGNSFRSSDSIFTFRLPYVITGQNAANLTFACRLFAGRKLLAAREQTFYVIPFEKDVADLKESLADVKRALPDLIESDYARERLAVLSTKLTGLAARTRLAGTLSSIERSALRDSLARLRADAQKLRAMTEAARKAGSTLAVYAANPWAPFGGIDEIVEGRTPKPEVTVEAFAGEIESAALNVANFSGRALIVRVEPEALVRESDSSAVPAKTVFSFHEVLDVPTIALDHSADALPELGQAQTLVLPPWSVRQLWMTVDAKALEPGEWHATLRLCTLEVEPAQAEAKLAIRVWKARLPERFPLRLCHWGYVHTSILKDQPGAALRDQVDHGTNVFVATGDFAPKATFDENGELVGSIDFSRHDEYVRRHSPHGIILFFNYQWSLKGPAERFTPTWEKAYKKWIGAWIDHLKGIGLDYEDYAFYPIDEPGLREGLVDQFIAYAKPIREVDPQAQIYADPVERASMSDLRRMAPYIDIWCPNRNGYLLKKGAEKLAYIKSTGKTVWTYECEGNAKHQSPLGYYRAQSWLVWHHGLTGIGFWSYCTSRYDPWYVPTGGNDYLLIYQGQGVVTSKRWEAVRDGMEDYSMLMQLKEALQEVSADEVPSETIKKARHLLQEEASQVARFCGLDDAGTLPGVEGMTALRKLEDERWAKIKNVRRRIAVLLDALSRGSE